MKSKATVDDVRAALDSDLNFGPALFLTFGGEIQPIETRPVEEDQALEQDRQISLAKRAAE